MWNAVKRFFVGIALLFKKSSEGAANATGLAPVPQLKQEVEHVVVKEQEDNYHKMTMNKSYSQLQYEKLIKDSGKELETPYATFGKLKSINTKNIDWGKKMHPQDMKEYLAELKMTEEEFIEFRKQIEAKTKKNEK